MITFKLSNTHVEPDSIKLRDKWELLINIEGNLVVSVNSTIFFNEQLPVVELAVELKKWLSKPIDTTFKYETIDDDETEIFNIIAVSSNSYIFNSIWQENECLTMFTRAEIVEFILNYIHQVKVEVKNKFSIDLNKKIGL